MWQVHERINSGDQGVGELAFFCIPLRMMAPYFSAPGAATSRAGEAPAISELPRMSAAIADGWT
jgi:hypothetical protein